MKRNFLIALTLMISFTARAATSSLECSFEDGHGRPLYSLKGLLGAKHALEVERIQNFNAHAVAPELLAEDINNNPVKAAIQADDSIVYAIDALDGDPDYGHLVTLTLVDGFHMGRMAAKISYVYVSRGEGEPDELDGVCETR